MDKASLTPSWDYFRTVNGIGLRAIAAIPADQLDARPIPGMRSVKDLVVHQYLMLKDLTDGVAKGEVVDSTPFEAIAAAQIHTRDELLTWCRARWDDAAKTVEAITDAQIAGTVKTPWGHDYKGAVMLQALFDEYWHHRGQLYCYLRALGVAPPSLYSFEDNDPAFQEKA